MSFEVIKLIRKACVRGLKCCCSFVQSLVFIVHGRDKFANVSIRGLDFREKLRGYRRQLLRFRHRRLPFTQYRKWWSFTDEEQELLVEAFRRIEIKRSAGVLANDQDHGVAARDASTETDADRNSRASHGSVAYATIRESGDDIALNDGCDPEIQWAEVVLCLMRKYLSMPMKGEANMIHRPTFIEGKGLPDRLSITPADVIHSSLSSSFKNSLIKSLKKGGSPSASSNPS